MYLERKLRRKKIKRILIVIIPVLILLIGTSFAFFTFYKANEAFILTMKGVPMQVEFKEGDNIIEVPFAYPISDEYAKVNLDKLGYVDFIVRGGTPNNEYLYYELYLTEEEGNTLDSNYIKVYLTDDKNEEIVEPSIYNKLPSSTSDNKNGKILYSESLTDIFEKKFRLYVWIDKDYTQNKVNQTFSFKVNLYAYNTEKPVLLSNAIRAKLNDSNSITNVDDEITYLSGTDDTINFNYVWYSGKLWRITSINPDGTMKMITQDDITVLSYGENSKYEGSWIYQFLNEDFLDTLYNYENIIVQDASWNATLLTSVEKPANTTIVKSAVGLLDLWEYSQSYAKVETGSNDGYLHIEYNWWFLTPHDELYTWRASGGVGAPVYNYSNLGVRPVICLKSNILSTGGDGSKQNPYRLLGDKIIFNEKSKLNNRLSGEYVKFDNKIYRIVDTENGITKLTSLDYIRNADGSIMKKQFSDGTTSYAEVSDSLDYWKGYLNNTWYNNITPAYKKMLVESTYYLGEAEGDSKINYKNTICSTLNTKELTKNCSRTSKIWKGYVGLPRIGEMFSVQLGNGYATSTDMWLITPYNLTIKGRLDNYVWYSGSVKSTEVGAVRPSITLNSNVYITSGNGMSPETPYEIECDSCS